MGRMYHEEILEKISRDPENELRHFYESETRTAFQQILAPSTLLGEIDCESIVHDPETKCKI